MLKDMKSFFAALDESCAHLISQVDFVDNKFGRCRSNDRPIFASHIDFDSIHCKIATQNLKIAERFSDIIVNNIAFLRKNLN